MSLELTARDAETLSRALESHGLRSTRQREQVFAGLLLKRDHPTADELYARCKEHCQGISLATVYNCLETLASCHLVRQVNLERGSTRYCLNLTPHAHFHDARTGHIHDIAIPPDLIAALRNLLPAGFEADSIEISFRGRAASSTSGTPS